MRSHDTFFGSFGSRLFPVLFVTVLGACGGPVEVPEGLDVQGHRGARGLYPENTVVGFTRALDLGVVTLEMDVVISADSQVVVSHDPVMSPVICSHPDGRPVGDDEQLRLFEMSYREIAAFDCGVRPHPDFPEQEPQPARKPLLREVIRSAEAHARATGRPAPFYNVETKSRPGGDTVEHPAPEVFATLVMDVLREEGVAGRSSIQSFDPRTLHVAHNAAWEGRLAVLFSTDRAQSWLSDLRSLPFKPDIISPHRDLVDTRLVAYAHEQDMKVIPWTANSFTDLQRLVNLNVDGVITDYPDRLVFRESNAP